VSPTPPVSFCDYGDELVAIHRGRFEAVERVKALDESNLGGARDRSQNACPNDCSRSSAAQASSYSTGGVTACDQLLPPAYCIPEPGLPCQPSPSGIAPTDS
jgi:hypothetical protein